MSRDRLLIPSPTNRLTRRLILPILTGLFIGSQLGASVRAEDATMRQKTPSLRPMKKHEAPSDLTGSFSRAELEARGYPWMKEGVLKARRKITKDSAEVNSLAASLDGVEIEIYFGSWCSDSHDHVPTFLAMLDAAKASGAEPKSLKWVALDRRKTFAGYVDTRKIEKLPTFVFLRNGREVGRIVETPEVSILADSVRILGPGPVRAQP